MESIPLFEIHKICRICLKSDILVSIFSPTFLVRPIDMIEKLHIFKFNPDESLPTLLCQSCLYRLLDAYNLQQLSESSESRLRDYMMNATGSSVLGLSAGEAVANPNSITLNKIMDNQETSCFSSSANGSQEVVEDNACIYENIYDMFERNASNDIEVEDDVLNDVVIDVSSLTRSEAEDTLSDIPPAEISLVDRTEISLEDQTDFSLMTHEENTQVVDTNKRNALDNQSTAKKLTKYQTKSLKTLEKCPKCPKIFNYSGYLEAHVRTHTGEKPYKCKICPRRFAQSSNLLLHTRTHTGERRFQCEICSSFFTTSSNLKAHKQTHLERRDFACSQCTLRFKTQRDLRKHEPVHKTTKDIVCPVCEKAFAKPCYLNAHMTAVHKRIRRHACTECRRVFSTRSNLTCHLRTHNGEKPYQCKQCPWKFNQSSSLVRHMKKHLNERKTDNTPHLTNESPLINNYLVNSKIELSAQTENINVVDKSCENIELEGQDPLPNLTGISTLNPQLMEVSGTEFAISSTSTLNAYDFSKESILDFSTSQQPQHQENIY